VKPIRILLADDHNVIRRGLRMLIENQPDFEVVAEASDGIAAVEQTIAARPDVVVLDIAMPRLSGTDAAARIKEKLPSTAIVILSMHADEGYVLRALKAGARGYILKDSAEGDLIGAIRAVYAGHAFFSPEVSRMLADDYVHDLRARGVADSYELLTAREREVLHLLAEGKSNKDIATLLNLSQYTVETHRRNIQDKLHLHGLADLILYAVRKGVIA
jgi:two-component system response regulator NreC